METEMGATTMKILDVGCGPCKRGDIGVDIKQYPGVDFCVDLEKNALPFPDDSFDLVVSYHFLEHVDDPELVLKEMLRVARVRVEVTVPHRYSIYAISLGHKVVFNKKWFQDFAKKYNLIVRGHYTVVPFLFVFSRVYEIVVEIWKRPL